jgi:ribonuclease HI
VALNVVGKRVGIGGFIRDDKGLVIAALSRTMEACPVPIIAEVMGELQATELCRDMGLSDIVLEGDSPQVVQAVNAKGDQWLCFGQIIADIQVVLSQFRRWEE